MRSRPSSRLGQLLVLMCSSPLLTFASPSADGASFVAGRVLDPQGRTVVGATVRLQVGTFVAAAVTTDAQGEFHLDSISPGSYRLTAGAPGFHGGARDLTIAGDIKGLDITLPEIVGQHQSVVITAQTVEASVDLRNAEVFNRTLFTRDDQVMQQLNAGIDAGQHEGGGKSLEIRRFGFNLDHGGTNGGLKVLVDGVQQNQGTQGHGQGYLGVLKALSPELIQDVTVINGPFSAEYGDFSGLGVVHIRQRESLPDQFTVRLGGGNFDTGRAFLGYSPDVEHVDAYVVYEGSYTDGPFQNPGRYRRDNFNANYTKSLNTSEKIGIRLLLGRNNFYSSGQIPLDLVSQGLLDRFGYIDPTHGGRVKLGTTSVYYSKLRANGDTFKADGFLSRSLLDLYSNFTMYLNDPVNGDAFQQHDSRLQQGLNAQYTHPYRFGSVAAVLVAGSNFHDNEINVGLYPRRGRVPTGVTTRANAHVTNGAGYVQNNLSLFRGRVLLGGGVRYDEFRFDVVDRVNPDQGGLQSAGRWQGKGNVAFRPAYHVPFTLTANYGRGINSVDARGVVQRPEQPRLATTDFYQFGTSSSFGRFGVSTDVFLIDHSHEQVYVPDDGSFEFKGPSRAYGYEAKTSVALTRWLSLNGGLTKIGNAYFRGGDHRVYVDSAPHFVANAALTVVAWHGWSGSLRMRAINRYRLDGDDPAILASGHTVFDFGLAKQVRRGVELNLSLDNLTNRDYYETQNYFESRFAPMAPIAKRLHGTPGYPLTAVVGLTFRMGRK
ncbi:MAG TPA: TonB-dependent receptor [Bryobacteraceae bacterium]|nr:TonB-dependent receptor [Bryobacteraceae bacterium]